MPCGWGGNRRSGSVRHRLQWFIHLRVHGLRKGDEHLAYTPDWVWYSFTFTPWMAPSSSGGFAIRCVLPVFWMTSFTHIILKALNRRQHGFDIAGCTQTDPPGSSTKQGAECDICDCLVNKMSTNVRSCHTFLYDVASSFIPVIYQHFQCAVGGISFLVIILYRNSFSVY